jgi:N-6 DNA Methylase
MNRDRARRREHRIVQVVSQIKYIRYINDHVTRHGVGIGWRASACACQTCRCDALGEYYTPDWLAKRTIDEVGFDGDPGTRVLGPACGSGTFLILAIERVRQWLANRSVEWGTNEKRREAVNLIRHHIEGFDPNPLAVIAARTNSLLALGPLLRYRGSGSDFEIPVYLTDSVLLPGCAFRSS